MCCGLLERRHFLGLAAGLAGAPLLPAAEWAADLWDPERPFHTRARPLTIQPVLMYQLPRRREAASWKSWGGVQTPADADAEARRIAAELGALASRAEFPLQVLPLERNTTPAAPADVTILYAAGGPGTLLRSLLPPDRPALIFVRHRSGPVSYWYEALSVRYLRPRGAPPDQRRLSVEDVVVDDPGELLWRLRALYAVKNFRGARILALGGPMGKYAPEAPRVARERFGLEILEAGYEDLASRIRSARADPASRERARQWAARYLSGPGVSLETGREFVVNAFLLYGIFHDLLREHDAQAFTINSCMGTILPMAETTACLTLSLLNDEGVPAFCESDFVVIPAGLLLRYIAGRPVFLHNSTFPHAGLVTCAHCTAPRRMDGVRYEPARILTHYESEYGAAPKIEMPVGQPLTFIDPDYATGRWLGLRGTVESNPFYQICRSQQDVRIQGDWKKLLDEVRDSHWVMAYGDYLNEIGYAVPRAGASWEVL